MGENIPFTKRGRFGVVQGSIDAKFSPYHAMVSTSSAEDLGTDKIIQMVRLVTLMTFLLLDVLSTSKLLMS